MKTPTSTTMSDVRGCLSMTERKRIMGGLFHHFRGKRYKYRTPVAETEKSVGGFEATIRAEKSRGRA
jgi:hypothetical protein